MFSSASVTRLRSVRLFREMAQQLRYMDRDELVELMKMKKVHKDFVVVDVRDDDYIGGNIKGAINEPSTDFLRNVDGLVSRTKEVPLVIFHCQLSQVRGPKAARIYASSRRNILDGKDIDHQVMILRDGFAEFQAKYRNDPELVENWDKDFWDLP